MKKRLMAMLLFSVPVLMLSGVNEQVIKADSKVNGDIHMVKGNVRVQSGAQLAGNILLKRGTCSSLLK